MGRIKEKREIEDKKMNRDGGKFILLGDTRIKIGNIKEYGISSQMKDYEKIYEAVEQPRGRLTKFLLGDKKLVWNGEMEKLTTHRRNELLESSTHYREVHDDYESAYRHEYTYKRFRNESGELVTSSSIATLENSVVKKRIRYLYITTFQNDNFQFFEDEIDFDITQKCSELDSVLCV